MITQTTPHNKDSSFLLPKISANFKRGHPQQRRQVQVGYVKIGDFRQITRYNSKTSTKRCQLSSVTNLSRGAFTFAACLPWYSTLRGFVGDSRYLILAVGLASHWPCVADSVVNPPTGQWPKKGRWAPGLYSSKEYGTLRRYVFK